MKIGNREVGPGQPVYLIAEAGSNHNGDLATATKLIHEAHAAGADAIKFQYFRADSMVERSHPDWAEYHACELPETWLYLLKKTAEYCGIHLFYSVFDPADVPLLEQYDPPAYKIASAEMGYGELREAVMETCKPVFLSTGLYSRLEALQARVFWGAYDIEVLHCVSAYPAPPEDMNLREIDGHVFTGLSDHTSEPFAAPLMAAALGACIVEKHFTLDRRQEGPDHAFAIEPHELKQLATALHLAHLMLGDGVKRVMPSEIPNLSSRRTLKNGRWLRG